MTRTAVWGASELCSQSSRTTRKSVGVATLLKKRSSIVALQRYRAGRRTISAAATALAAAAPSLELRDLSDLSEQSRCVCCCMGVRLFDGRDRRREL